jgi:hypothetical protein
VLEAESNPSTVQYLNLLSRKKKCRFFTPFGVEALIGAYPANNRNGRKPFLNKPILYPVVGAATAQQPKDTNSVKTPQIFTMEQYPNVLTCKRSL